jgi:hypothetical protein
MEAPGFTVMIFSIDSFLEDYNLVWRLPVGLGRKHALEEPARLSKDGAALRDSLHLALLSHIRHVPGPALYHRVFYKRELRRSLCYFS